MSLDDLRIASPCTMKFSEMKGDERRRFCSQCKLNVFNLSALTRAEATALVTTAEGRTCVTLFRRPDGTVLTSDCRGFGQNFAAQFNRFERTMGWATVAAVLSAVAIASFVTLFGPRVMSLFFLPTTGAVLSGPTRTSSAGKVSAKKRINSLSSDRSPR